MQQAHCDPRFCQEDERVNVARQEPAEENVAELPARGPDERGVPEPDEDADGDEGEEDPEHGDAHRHQGEHRLPAHVLKERDEVIWIGFTGENG